MKLELANERLNVFLFTIARIDACYSQLLEFADLMLLDSLLSMSVLRIH